MPDMIQLKALEEQEKKRQEALEARKRLRAVKNPLPQRKIEWTDPPQHDPGEWPKFIPLPNRTYEKPKFVTLPGNPNEPLQVQKLPYLIHPKKQEDSKPAGMAENPSMQNTVRDQKAQATRTPALFDAVSPMGRGLAKMMAVSGSQPEQADSIYQFLRLHEKDPDSPYFRPYARPTNQSEMDELNQLGIDTSDIGRQWFEKNAWLRPYVRTDVSGLPVHPGSGGSKEEKAAYHYARLQSAQGTTERAEAELNSLAREIGYWAGRKDRSYSDAEVLGRIDWNKYPTLAMLRADQQRGLPTALNKAIDFDSDTEIGMLWSARNKASGGSHVIGAARYALGEGQQYQPDAAVKALRDPQSPAYNPYALGSTVDDAAQYFGVDAFDVTWLQKNRRILQTGNETAIRMYGTVEKAERFTRQAEAEAKDLHQAIDARLDQAAVLGRVDADHIVREALSHYPALRRMDERRLTGSLAQTTRALNYRVEDVAAHVQKQAEVILRRMGSVFHQEDMEAAALNEKSAALSARGNLLQPDIAPISLTARRNLLWEDGLLAARPHPFEDGSGITSSRDAGAIATAPEATQAETAEWLEAAGLFGAAAQAGYNKLLATLVPGGETAAQPGLSTLAHAEWAVSQAARVLVNTAKAYQTGAAYQMAQAGYDHMANALLGIGQAAVGEIASFLGAAVGKNAQARPGTAGLVSLLMETGAGALTALTQNLLEDKGQPLSLLQTFSRVLQLYEAASGEKTKAGALANQALAEAVSQNLSSTQVYTGNSAFDTIATVAVQGVHNMAAATKRWGAAGVNYFANLTAAGHGAAAAILQTLPSYARSVIAAEQNMRTLTLSPGMLLSQLKALKQDLLSPEILDNAARRARLQAENAIMSLKIAGGALGGLSAFQKEVDDAKAAHDKSLSALEMAGKEKQDVSRLHAMLSKQFLSNLSNTAIGNNLLSVIDRLQTTAEKYRKAEGDAANSQNMLTAVQQKHDTANRQIMGPLRAEVKKEIEQRQKEAQLQWLRSGDPSLIVSILKNHPEFNFYTLAPNAGSDIMKGQSDQGAAGDTGGKDGAAADKGSNPYSHLGIEDADYQAYLEGKLTEDDLLGIANAASYYEAASGPGAGRFLYQNEAHKWAASIRAKYDPDYIKNDTYDYTHSGLYDPNRVEPMPGPPVFKVLTSLPEDGNEEAQASDEDDTLYGLSTDDYLNAVLTPNQRRQKETITKLVLEKLSDDQKQRIENGEDIGEIIKELPQEQQDEIAALVDKVELMTYEQIMDFSYLQNELLYELTIAERLVVLQHLKENNGHLAPDELKKLATDALGGDAEGDFFREMSQLSEDSKELSSYADWLKLPYRFRLIGTTFEEENANYMEQKASEAFAVASLSMINMVSVAIDRWLFGRAPSPSDIYNRNSPIDNTEKQGTTGDIKGSNLSWNPPEGTNQEYYTAKSSGWKKPDGSTWWPDNYEFDDVPEKMTLQPGTRIDRYGSDKGIFASPEGIPFDQRALAPGSENSPYNNYEVIKPFDVNAGKAAPWFDQPGGGTQYLLPMTIKELLDARYIKIIIK